MCKASGAGGEDEAHLPPPLLVTVLPFERCGDGVTNRALVKEETIPRSGGPLDSDLLIRQALSRPPSLLSPARASGGYLSAARSGSR